MNIFDEVTGHHPRIAHFMHPGQEPHPMTTSAADDGPVSTLAQAIHRDLGNIRRALDHGLPLLERIVTSPQLDEFLELALRADGLGVEASVFAAAADVLRGAMGRRAATGLQAVLNGDPLPQREPGATVTGPQPALSVQQAEPEPAAVTATGPQPAVPTGPQPQATA